MTKQEQIEKMAQAMCGYCKNSKCLLKSNGACDKFKSQDCVYKENAEALYDACYRKVLLDTEKIEKVRKETAREILYMLYDMGIDKGTLECCRIFDVNGVSLAKQICEKYDVEIEK